MQGFKFGQQSYSGSLFQDQLQGVRESGIFGINDLIIESPRRIRNIATPKQTWDSDKPGEGLRSLQGWKLVKHTADPPSIELPLMVRTAASYNLKLWETKKFSDFAVVVASKEFQVHKIVLAGQSSVFASMIETDEQVAVSNKLEIKDCSGEVVEEFLRCLYGSPIKVENYENALTLYSLASTFEVDELKLMLEEVLLNNLEDEHAIKALKIGNLHSAEKIIAAAFHRIKRKYPNDIQAEGLKHKPERVEDIVNEINRSKEAIRNLNII